MKHPAKSPSVGHGRSALERSKLRTGVLFILPSLIICGVFVIWPLIKAFQYSLTDWNGISSTL